MRTLRNPVLVIVNGHAATGKTTLARKLSEATGLPLFTKDGFKERLHEALGSSDRDASRALGRTSFSLLQHSAEIMLAAGQGLILEANFDPEFSGGWITDLEQRFSSFTIQVFLKAQPETILRRFTARFESGRRHDTHMDDIAVDELRLRLESPLDPLTVRGHTIVIDTTEFANLDTVDVVGQVTALLRPAEIVS